MRPAPDSNANIGQFPEWYRTHWRSLGRIISDVTEIMANGFIFRENASHTLRTLTVRDAQGLQITHELRRSPIIQCTGGRILCYRVLDRDSSTATVWCKLPSTYVYPPGNSQAQGSYSRMVCEDTGWFSVGDIVSIGGVRAAVTTSRDGILVLDMPVLLTGRTRVSLYQESIDLLLY